MHSPLDENKTCITPQTEGKTDAATDMENSERQGET